MLLTHSANSIPLPCADKRTHIRWLICQYLSFDILHDRLQDLPSQFTTPQPRPWSNINRTAISPQQLHNFDLDIYLAIVVAAIETEIPIRGYSQTSRQYLKTLHPPMARFVGGRVDSSGKSLEKGLWELEERRHTPALLNIYRQLSGQSPPLVDIRKVRDYAPTGNPHADLYRHGLHRIATEYGATSLYLWLMSYSTGTLRQVWGELLRDEINHMTKFWGFGAWAYPHTAIAHLRNISTQLTKTIGDRPELETFAQPDKRQGPSSLPRTLRRMAEVMHWQTWSHHHRAEFSLTCMRVLAHMLRWSRSLTPGYLQQVFGPQPFPTET